MTCRCSEQVAPLGPPPRFPKETGGQAIGGKRQNVLSSVQWYRIFNPQPLKVLRELNDLSTGEVSQKDFMAVGYEAGKDDCARLWKQSL